MLEDMIQLCVVEVCVWGGGGGEEGVARELPAGCTVKYDISRVLHMH